MSCLENDKIMDRILDHIDVVLEDERIKNAIDEEIGQHEDYYGDNHEEIEEKVTDYLIEDIFNSCEGKCPYTFEEVKELAYEALEIE